MKNGDNEFAETPLNELYNINNTRPPYQSENLISRRQFLVYLVFSGITIFTGCTPTKTEIEGGVKPANKIDYQETYKTDNTYIELLLNEYIRNPNPPNFFKQELLPGINDRCDHVIVALHLRDNPNGVVTYIGYTGVPPMNDIPLVNSYLSRYTEPREVYTNTKASMITLDKELIEKCPDLLHEARWLLTLGNLKIELTEEELRLGQYRERLTGVFYDKKGLEEPDEIKIANTHIPRIDLKSHIYHELFHLHDPYLNPEILNFIPPEQRLKYLELRRNTALTSIELIGEIGKRYLEHKHGYLFLNIHPNVGLNHPNLPDEELAVNYSIFFEPARWFAEHLFEMRHGLPKDQIEIFEEKYKTPFNIDDDSHTFTLFFSCITNINEYIGHFPQEHVTEEYENTLYFIAAIINYLEPEITAQTASAVALHLIDDRFSESNDEVKKEIEEHPVTEFLRFIKSLSDEVDSTLNYN